MDGTQNPGFPAQVASGGFSQKNSNPQNLDMSAWSNLVNVGSNFDQTLPKMFQGRDVCGSFGQAWVREVVGWGLLIGSEGGLLIGSSRPDPNFGLINPSLLRAEWVSNFD